MEKNKSDNKMHYILADENGKIDGNYTNRSHIFIELTCPELYREIVKRMRKKNCSQNDVDNSIFDGYLTIYGEDRNHSVVMNTRLEEPFESFIKGFPEKKEEFPLYLERCLDAFGKTVSVDIREAIRKNSSKTQFCIILKSFRADNQKIFSDFRLQLIDNGRETIYNVQHSYQMVIPD